MRKGGNPAKQQLKAPAEKESGPTQQKRVNSAGTEAKPRTLRILSRSLSMRAAVLATLIFATLYSVTVVETTADTPVYVAQIIQYHLKGASASPALLWEFGHFLWRPVAYGLWRVMHPALSFWSGDDARLEITAIFFGINFVVGMGLTLLLLLLSFSLGLQTPQAVAITTAFMLFSTILRYVHSGMSYNLGFMLQIGALWLIANGLRPDRPRSTLAFLGGVALALSCAVWFPYILSVPSVLLAAWFVTPQERNLEDNLQTRIRGLLIATSATAVVGLSMLAFGIWINHLSSYDLLKQWIVSSAHGVIPENRLVRLPTGIARSFLFFGEQGVALKRFVLGDPYAPTHFTDLLPALWKVGVVFGTLAVIGIALARYSWRGLAVLLCAFVPTIAFAVLLFETSEPARYEPVYPALLIAVAAILSLGRRAMVYERVLVCFAIIMAAVNLTAFTWTLRSTNTKVVERAQLVHDHAAPHGVAYILSFRDPLSTFLQRSPFSPLNRPGALPLYNVIEPGNKNVITWRQDAGCRGLRAWNDGGEIWVSDRLIAERPEPGWEWVEMDDRRVHWGDVRDYFRQFAQDEHIGTDDGFFRVVADAQNRQQLEKICAGSEY